MVKDPASLQETRAAGGVVLADVSQWEELFDARAAAAFVSSIRRPQLPGHPGC